METWAKQFLLRLSPTLVHRFDGIKVRSIYNYSPFLFHERIPLFSHSSNTIYPT
jgi:hypothetical protein